MVPFGEALKFWLKLGHIATAAPTPGWPVDLLALAITAAAAVRCSGSGRA